MDRIRKWQIASTVVLCLVLVDDIDRFVAVARRMSIIDRLLDAPFTVSIDDVRASDQAVRTADGFYLPLFLIAAAFFITWMVTMANAAELARPDALRYSPGWAMGAWFVPILNLIRPPKIVNDFYAVDRSIIDPQTCSPLVGWWWGCFLCSDLLGVFAEGLSQGNSLTELQSATQCSLVSVLFNMAAAALCIAVLIVLTRRARDREPATPDWGADPYDVGEPAGMAPAPPAGPPPLAGR